MAWRCAILFFSNLSRRRVLTSFFPIRGTAHHERGDQGAPRVLRRGRRARALQDPRLLGRPEVPPRARRRRVEPAALDCAGRRVIRATFSTHNARRISRHHPSSRAVQLFGCGVAGLAAGGAAQVPRRRAGGVPQHGLRGCGVHRAVARRRRGRDHREGARAGGGLSRAGARRGVERASGVAHGRGVGGGGCVDGTFDEASTRLFGCHQGSRATQRVSTGKLVFRCKFS